MGTAVARLPLGDQSRQRLALYTQPVEPTELKGLLALRPR